MPLSTALQQRLQIRHVRQSRDALLGSQTRSYLGKTLREGKQAAGTEAAGDLARHPERSPLERAEGPEHPQRRTTAVTEIKRARRGRGKGRRGMFSETLREPGVGMWCEI